MRIFDKVAVKPVKRSRFDLSHDVKLSMRLGQIVPSGCWDLVPGDTFRFSPQNFLRFAPMIAPIFHRVRVKSEFFFVPNRILWPNWENFITDKNTHAAPVITIDGGITEGSIMDFLGYPAGDLSAAGTFSVDALPLAAYAKIYDDYYRQQDLMTEQFVVLEDGGGNPDYESYSTKQPFQRCWERDYFTSCSPTPQFGAAVAIPLTDDQNPLVTLITGQTKSPILRGPDGTGVQNSVDIITDPSGNIGSAVVDGTIDPNGTLEVDVQSVATTIERLRAAFSLQGFLELMMRAGHRYIELVRSAFGVTSSDARLQRPEMIGQLVQNIVVSEVLATAENTAAEVPVGQMAGHGISVGGGTTFEYTAEEHGFIICIVSVIPDTAYQQGLPRRFTRFDRLDYLWPQFANLGEQPVLNGEIYMNQADHAQTFGYQQRYAEYRSIPSRVSGAFRSSLNFWHMGRIFDAPPVLNESFLAADPTPRIFSVTEPDADQVFAHIFFNIDAIRPLPKYAIPSTL